MSKTKKNKKSEETDEVEDSATKQEISEKEIKRKLKEKCIKSKNGCLIWNGSMNDGVCKLYYHGDQINIKKALWDFKYSDNKMDSKHKLTNTCENKRCVNINHIKKEPFKKEMNKKELWKELKQNGKRIKMNDKTKELGIGCLEWTKSKYSGGYGAKGVGDKTYRVHKLSYWIHSDYDKFEDIPLYKDPINKKGKLDVNHKCDNPICFEPTHLRFGTHKSGMHKDKIRNGTSQRGEQNKGAKITEEVALKIKHSKYPKDHKKYKTQKERAEIFEVEYCIVVDIDANRTWKHLPDRHGKINIKKDKLVRKQGVSKYQKAEQREWTKSMWKEAKKRLYTKAPLDKKVTSKSDKIKTPCRIMPGKRDKDGYGFIRIYGRQRPGHVYAAEIKQGFKMEEHEKKMIASHRCGNPACCRISHIRVGTRRKDALDKLKHGTQRGIKLTPEIVLEIRRTKGNDGLTQKERAEKYKLDVKYLYLVETGKRWGHIKEPDLKKKSKHLRKNNISQDI